MNKTTESKELTGNGTGGESRREFLKTNLGRTVAAAAILAFARDDFAGHHRNIGGAHGNSAEHTNKKGLFGGKHTNTEANHTNVTAMHDNYLCHSNYAQTHQNAGRHANTMTHVNELPSGCGHANLATHANQVQGHDNYANHSNY